jgi:maltooligosyltrehalose trehalohydrolase
VETGATYLGGGRGRFTVWAPLRDSMELEITAPEPRRLPLVRLDRGYWQTEVDDLEPGTRYRFRLDGSLPRPDPASHYQPNGVHGDSSVVDHEAFAWSDGGWRCPALDRLVFYELHVGAFTPEGGFAAAANHLEEIAELGANAVELMPVAAFPGERNWGYDGVYPYSVQHCYGGPEGLKRLVDACHRRGLAVVLDVVYNHLGPEGNYLRDFGPYFTEAYRTPWGQAVNFDGTCSDEVRAFFLHNARHWLQRYHIDALRLDAVHAIYDFSAHPFLLELSESVGRWSGELGRPLYLVAESDANDVRLIRPASRGGCALQAQWSDDFHHALHALLTGERTGYYSDFGGLADLAKAYRESFVYDWRYSAYRRRRHGSPAAALPPGRFVVCIQNHDQVGNRLLGERLSTLVSFEAYKLATAALLLSPYIPLLFMGQEYGERNPFLYFVSHSDPALVEAVRRGRREEFRSFAWSGELPDPQAEDTFLRSKLSRERRNSREGRVLLDFHRELIGLRRRAAALATLQRSGISVEAIEEKRLLVLQRRAGSSSAYCLLSFKPEDQSLDLQLPAGSWNKALDSSLPRWLGPGSRLPGRLHGRLEAELRGFGCAVYIKEEKQPP